MRGLLIFLVFTIGLVATTCLLFPGRGDILGMVCMANVLGYIEAQIRR